MAWHFVCAQTIAIWKLRTFIAHERASTPTVTAYVGEAPFSKTCSVVEPASERRPLPQRTFSRPASRVSACFLIHTYFLWMFPSSTSS